MDDIDEIHSAATGRSIGWDTIHNSRSTHLKATQECISSQDEQSGITVKQVDSANGDVREATTSPAVCAWAMTFVPLLVNDVIKALRAANQSHFTNTHAILVMTTDTMRICTEDKCKEFDEMPVGTHFFKRSEPPQANQLVMPS